MGVARTTRSEGLKLRYAVTLSFWLTAKCDASKNFPTSATLIEKHETEKKRRKGIVEDSRGRKAAALDARGAALGSVGLACFAVALWLKLPALNAPLGLLAASAIWLSVTVLLWVLARMH